MFALGRLDETLLHHIDDEVSPLEAPALRAPTLQTWIDAPAPAPTLVPEPEPAEAEAPFPALLDLRQLADPEADCGDDPEAWHLPPPGIHTTGSQLRHRLVTTQSIAELEAHRKPSLLGKLFGRFSGQK